MVNESHKKYVKAHYDHFFVLMSFQRVNWFSSMIKNGRS